MSSDVSMQFPVGSSKAPPRQAAAYHPIGPIIQIEIEIEIETI